MIAKKVKNILFTIGIGFTVLGIALFILIPLICGDGFAYDGVQTLLTGIKNFVTFDFKNTAYVFLFVLTVITILCLIWWMIILIVKKSGKSAPQYIFAFIFVCGIMIMLETYFVASVTFNGSETKLFDAVLALHGEQDLGMWLSMLVLGLMYVSLMFLTLYAFIDIYQVVVGFPKDKVIEVPVPLEVKVPYAVEVPCEKEVEEEEEPWEDRKAREEALFAHMKETGEFEIYEEWELDEPLEGFDEEPVVEDVEVQEETVFHKPTRKAITYTIIND